jgi:hypothetical protein
MTDRTFVQPAADLSTSRQGNEHPIDPRSDLKDGLGWMALGVAILIGSLLMDRLEKQDINPYTAPGLLPGLLGIVMTLLGFLLFVRSWRRRGLHPVVADPAQGKSAVRRRIALVLALCTTFAVVLVGHGMPFWLASALFVTVTILCLQYSQHVEVDHKLTPRKVIITASIGLGAGLIITLVFQEIFLVRLP